MIHAHSPVLSNETHTKVITATHYYTKHKIHAFAEIIITIPRSSCPVIVKRNLVVIIGLNWILDGKIYDISFHTSCMLFRMTVKYISFALNKSYTVETFFLLSCNRDSFMISQIGRCDLYKKYYSHEAMFFSKWSCASLLDPLSLGKYTKSSDTLGGNLLPHPGNK